MFIQVPLRSFYKYIFLIIIIGILKINKLGTYLDSSIFCYLNNYNYINGPISFYYKLRPEIKDFFGSLKYILILYTLLLSILYTILYLSFPRGYIVENEICGSKNRLLR